MKIDLTIMMLISLLGTSIAYGENTSEATKVGFEIINSRQLGNCVTCHTVDYVDKAGSNQLEKQGNFGPNLQGVGKKYSRLELIQWVSDARKIHPDTLMPPYGTLEDIKIPNQSKTMLSPQQIQFVVDALLTLN